MANSLINWFKNKTAFENNKTPALNGTTLNQMQSNIEKDLSDFIQENPSIFGSGMPVGSGCDFFGTTAPENYMFANGTAISRTDYAELFAIIGTTYGAGDGSTAFNLPDKRERVSVMVKDGSTNFGTLGGKVGSDTQKLTAGQLPKLTGSVKLGAYIDVASNEISLFNNPTGIFSTTDVSQSQYRAQAGEQVSKCTNEQLNISFGNNEEHNNIQQSLVCNYIIKVK